jgi:hypothetical protein
LITISAPLIRVPDIRSHLSHSCFSAVWPFRLAWRRSAGTGEIDETPVDCQPNPPAQAGHERPAVLSIFARHKKTAVQRSPSGDNRHRLVRNLRKEIGSVNSEMKIFHPV